MPGGSTWAPTTTDDWVRAIDKRVTNLERRARGNDLTVSGAMQPALLEGTYVGEGPARVIVNGTLVGPFDWMGQYDPRGSRMVYLVRSEGQYRILGHAYGRLEGGWERLPTLNGWRSYSFTVADHQWGDRARVTRLPSGIVVLSGLLSAGTTAADTTIATLPAEMRPDTDMMFPVNNADITRGLKVLATGEVQLSSAAYTSTYVSLDGIAFPAAGVATWTPITTFVNGWVDFGAARWGAPRYWVDPYGTMWFAGLIKSGTATGETVMFTVPGAVRPHLEEHCVVVSNEAFGAIGGDTGTGNIVVKTVSNVWVSLCGVIMQTTAAYTGLPWQTPVFQNAWQNHTGTGTLFPTPGYVRREDGLAMTRGLINGGTIGATAFSLPLELHPRPRIILSTVSNTARGRIDLYNGNLAAHQGSNTWFSLDSQKWSPGGTY